MALKYNVYVNIKTKSSRTGTTYNNFGRNKIAIYQSLYEKSVLETAWSNLSYTTPIFTLGDLTPVWSNFLSECGCRDSALPFPEVTDIYTISNNDQFSSWMRVYPNYYQLTGITFTDSWRCLLDNNDTGLIFSFDSSPGAYYFNGTSYVNAGAAGGFGFTATSATALRACVMFFTKDNYFAILNLFENRNNSSFRFFSATDSENIATWFENLDDVPDDPYVPGGGSGPGGGEGDFDGTSDTVPVPSLPSISITDSGFLTLFKASQSDLRSLANYLWSNLFSAILPGGTMEETITTLKKVVANPYDAILGCSIVPVSVGTTTAKNIKMYGVIDSGISLPVVSSQYAIVDCGTLNIKEFWKGYLDYSPYTKVTSLYLPYIGVVSIDVDQIMGTAVQIIYHIDILSGQCIAYIVVDGSVEFQYQGHCSTAIPITSVDYTNTIQSGLSLVGSIANIGAGMFGAAAMPGLAGVAATAGAAITGAAGQAGSIANAVMGSKPDIKSGSGVGGMGGLMSVQTPFLIIERPRQSLPEVVDSSGTTVTQKHWTGYPSNVAVNLSNITGYVEVARINVNKMTATAAEKDEITALLSGGVYIA